MFECSLTNSSWTWIKLIKACSLLFSIFLKSTLTHVVWRSSLNVSLNLLALSFVTRAIRIFNESLGVAWITLNWNFILLKKEKYMRFYQRIDLEMVKSLEGFCASKVRTSPSFLKIKHNLCNQRKWIKA
jgi:hypothetical protein